MNVSRICTLNPSPLTFPEQLCVLVYSLAEMISFFTIQNDYEIISIYHEDIWNIGSYLFILVLYIHTLLYLDRPESYNVSSRIPSGVAVINCPYSVIFERYATIFKLLVSQQLKMEEQKIDKQFQPYPIKVKLDKRF